jgi:YcaO-like protein with predicted kinase domain
VSGTAPPLLAGLRDDPGPKRYRAGTHRVASPAETLERFRPLAGRMGITRVGMITKLDRIGIPVAFATRPNSRSIAVFQGKGLTDDAARASAFMEAAELWHAETVVAPQRLARLADLREAGVAVAVEGLVPCGAATLPPHRLVPWVEARDLATGEAVLAPLEVVHADYTAAMTALTGTHFQSTTNGLASGNTLAEAVAHALYEVVERDAVTLWMARRDEEEARRALDPGTIVDPVICDLIGRFEAAGVVLRLWDVTSDIGLPAFVCLAADGVGNETDPEIGSGCHVDQGVALARAVTEAAQSRTAFIAGARDDLAPDLYGAERRRRRARASAAWLAAPQTRPLAPAAIAPGETIHDDLATAVGALRRVGLDRVLVVDLTRPDVRLPVARVIVPGLEGAVESDDARPPAGPRLARLSGGGA